jgi:maltooligosyltrehalose trehalohydrolase
MVMLDVVYNHFGPEGNYLGRYAPTFFTEAHTPWGSAIDYRVPQVRAFAIENALHWLRDYRFDGLRLDAVNSIVEPGGLSLLHDLSAAVGELAKETGRHIHLVLENGDNRASILDAAQDPPQGKYRAQWNDDYHHAWRVLMTAEKQGYYCDYQHAPLQDIARSLSSGFVYQGELSAFRGGARGEPSGALSPMAFINFLQNHDQIGNRPLGDRLESVARTEAIEAALAVMLLAPAIPMLFMGEEWGSKTPFPFFCDFKGGLADAVREGRRSEYEWAYAEYGDDVPDALDLPTFQSAVLDWDEPRQAVPQKRLKLVRDLLAIRRKEIAPRLAGAAFGEASAAADGLLTADWRMGDGVRLALVANLSDRDVSHAPAPSKGTLIWGSELNERVPPWSVVWRLG